jgi:HAE1 family hydrophobic/amphiphilic exporter-1
MTLRLKSLKDRSRSTDQIIEKLQEKLKIPGARLRIHAQSSMRMLYGSSDNPIAIDIRGYDQDLAKQVVYEVQEKLSQVPGVVNVNMSRDEERPEIAVRINRKRAADLGIDASAIGKALESNVEGTVATVFRNKGEEIDVRVYLQEADLRERRDLGNIVVHGSDGQLIPLLSVVDLVQSNGPVNIERSGQERNITVNAGISKRDLGSVMADVRRELGAIKLPPGIQIYYGGDYEEQQQSFNELLVALMMSLLLIYMVMAAQFESLVDPFIIMFSVPFALGGVLLMLFLTDTNFNNQAYIGLIMLGGVVVNNAIVLISYIRILMEQGGSLTDAVEKGSQSRLRPILITTISSILGLLPLALGLGEGGELQAPLARTVIGGLSFSTVLTLILIPAIFFI